MAQDLPILSIVIPCFNEEDVLPHTLEALCGSVASLEAANRIAPESGIFIVDDGSTDATWDIVRRYAENNDTIDGCRLAGNSGQQAALLAGLFNATGDLLLTMDADLQDDIGAIPEMIEKAAAGADIVFGIRKARPGDSWFKRFTAAGFYRLMRMLGAKIPGDHSDYRLMSRRAVEALRGYRETNLFLRGIVATMGFPTAVVLYDHLERRAGISKYPVSKSVSLALSAITSFSMRPLRAISVFGMAISFLTAVGAFWVLWIALATERAVPGWASIALPIMFLGGVQLLSLGVIGEYVGRIYMETKRRPHFIVSDHAGQSPKIRDHANVDTER